jgi:uncharacterized MAPEG superfamily protein
MGELSARARAILTGYPLALLAVGIVVNIFIGVQPAAVALPSMWCLRAMAAAALLLVVNHTWLMTATEMSRARFEIYASPEEYEAEDRSATDASAEGLREVERHHNVHLNDTENAVRFVAVAVVFMFISPADLAAGVWLVGYGVARLGYTYSYLRRMTDWRGAFMTLGLVSMYGVGSYVLLSLIR